jgi:hypothetical protein
MPMPTSPWQKRAWGLCLLLLVPLCPSCSSSGLNTVQGTVTVKGQPVKGAVVIFHPKGGEAKGQRPSGVTKEDGTFTLGTGNKPGAPPGDYVVTITWPVEEGPVKFKKGSTEQEEPPLVDQLKGRYANAANSTLTATIKSGSNKLNPFELN